MNCPNPGGKVSVDMRRVTTAGQTNRLQGEEKTHTFEEQHPHHHHHQRRAKPLQCFRLGSAWLGSVFLLSLKEDKLFEQELIDGLLFPHRLDDQPVQIHVERASESTRDTTEEKKRSDTHYYSHPESWRTRNAGSVGVMRYPSTAKAGSSCRSKGKSRRNRVLNRAVIVSAEGKELGDQTRLDQTQFDSIRFNMIRLDSIRLDLRV